LFLRYLRRDVDAGVGEDAGYVTGSRLVVDGGLSLCQ